MFSAVGLALHQPNMREKTRPTLECEHAIRAHLTGQKGALLLSIRSLIFNVVTDPCWADEALAQPTALTLRNWLIGCYIVEYEMNGNDRAKYGAKLLPLLAQELQRLGLVRSEERELRRYRQFYQTYPQIRESLPPALKRLAPSSR